MSDFTLSPHENVFPRTTSVKAYPASNWSKSRLPPSGAPVGTQDATATAGAGGTAFTGLDASTRYYAYAQVATEHRYIGFTTHPANEAATLDVEQTFTQTLTIEPPSGEQALIVRPSGATPTSASVGGGVLMDFTDATGQGLVIYTNQGASQATGARPLTVKSDNALFDGVGAYFQYEGVGHGVIVDHQGTGSSSNAFTVVSTNDADTALGVRGCESGRGTLKITHEKPDGIVDQNAAIISTVLSRQNAAETTQAQHIFLDSDHTLVDTIQVIQHRNNGTKKWALYQGGFQDFNESNGSTDPGAPAANFARLYARDNGAGKTQLCVRFPTGAVQVFATEP